MTGQHRSRGDLQFAVAKYRISSGPAACGPVRSDTYKHLPDGGVNIGVQGAGKKVAVHVARERGLELWAARAVEPEFPAVGGVFRYDTVEWADSSSFAGTRYLPIVRLVPMSSVEFPEHLVVAVRHYGGNYQRLATGGRQSAQRTRTRSSCRANQIGAVKCRLRVSRGPSFDRSILRRQGGHFC